MEKQTIKCDVRECKYNETKNQECTLNKIEISGAYDKFDTFCNSFEEAQ